MKLLHNSNKKQGKVELKNVIYNYFYLCLDHKKLVPKTDKETYSIKRRIQGLAQGGKAEPELWKFLVKIYCSTLFPLENTNTRFYSLYI